MSNFDWAVDGSIVGLYLLATVVAAALCLLARRPGAVGLARAVAVVAILWGPSAPQWLRAYQEYGLKGKLPLLTLGDSDRVINLVG